MSASDTVSTTRHVVVQYSCEDYASSGYDDCSDSCSADSMEEAIIRALELKNARPDEDVAIVNDNGRLELATIPKVDVESSYAVCAVRKTVADKARLSELLGYKIGKNRIWLTHADIWFLKAKGVLTPAWEQSKHPSPDFTGPWDLHRKAYLEAQLESEHL